MRPAATTIAGTLAEALEGSLRDRAVAALAGARRADAVVVLHGTTGRASTRQELAAELEGAGAHELAGEVLERQVDAGEILALLVNHDRELGEGRLVALQVDQTL